LKTLERPSRQMLSRPCLSRLLLPPTLSPNGQRGPQSSSRPPRGHAAANAGAWVAPRRPEGTRMHARIRPEHACSIAQPNAHNRRQQEADGCRKENWRSLRIEAFTSCLKDFSHSTLLAASKWMRGKKTPFNCCRGWVEDWPVSSALKMRRGCLLARSRPPPASPTAP
jgi:hypothetical protein